MAGIFLQTSKVFNRAPQPIFVFFDGERREIPVGESILPNKTLYHAKNQNPIMGSGDPENPHEDGTRYLLVEEHEPGFGVPMTDEEWADHLGKPCRVDEQAAFVQRYGGDPKAKLVMHGKGQKSTAKNRFEAGTPPRGNADFTHQNA